MHRGYWTLVAVSVVGAACGGIAVIDVDGSGGGATQSSVGGSTPTASVVTSTTTSMIEDLCTACQNASVDTAGSVVNAEITEASGIARSRIHDDVYYVHNDSGGAPRFFAIDSAGNDLGSWVVDEAAAIDWEDIATGPCFDGAAESCIYLGDIGDNAQTRSSYTLYRVREPAVIGQGGNLVGDSFPFMYPNGSRNAEALVSDPASGQLFIVTKTAGTAEIYRFPLELSFGVQPELVGGVSIPIGSTEVTGASASSSGVLLRTYSNVILYANGDDVLTQLSRDGCPVNAPGELQGEAVSWRADGAGYVTVAEGNNPPVYEMRCSR